MARALTRLAALGILPAVQGGGKRTISKPLSRSAGEGGPAHGWVGEDRRASLFHRESGVFKTSYAADMALYPLPIAKWAVAAFAGLFIVVVPLALDEYNVSILNLILIAVVGALGLNILVGYTEQISIGHGAFMSVGAYTAANLVVQLDAPFWITIPAGGLMAALIGAVVGIPSLRIKGLYLAIATLAAQLIIEWTINHVPAISGGMQASIQVPPPEPVRHQAEEPAQIYLFLMFFVVLAVVGTSNLVRSRIGRAFIAIRDQDIAAEIIGIDIFRYKLAAFAISSFYAGVTGVLYTYYLGIANYEQFQINVSIDYLAMVIIGGLGSILGLDLRRDLRHPAADRDPLVSRIVRRPVLFAGRSRQHDPESAADPVRRPDHLLSGGRAGRAQPVVAKHPKLLSGVAVFLLRQATAKEEREMKSLSRIMLGVAGRMDGLWLPAPRRRSKRRC